MLWIIATPILLIVAVVFFLIGTTPAKKQDERETGPRGYRERESENPPTWVWSAIGGVLVAFWLLFTGISSFHQIGAGYVGVVYQFGGIVGQVPEGFQTTTPWQNVQTWDIRTQRIRPETKCFDEKIPDCLEAFSSETQDVFIRATINLSVNPEDVQKLARTVGSDYVAKLVLPRLHQIVKDITVRYRSVDIAPNREEIRAAIKERMKVELAERSINVEDLLIDNMDFRPEFKQAIEAKQIASQEALRQQELVAAKQAEARQKAAEAEGNASKLRIEAQGQADANRAINESLTPLLIQFQALQKLAPDVKIVFLPSGQGIIIDPSTILGGVQK